MAKKKLTEDNSKKEKETKKPFVLSDIEKCTYSCRCPHLHYRGLSNIWDSFSSIWACSLDNPDDDCIRS